ncbi:GNAT family N-acetyltransferase [Solihabitans fulvus]|uniref:GNAT family N-acetyltransferase n=1 Tax=Solihabitans fulvus TaxID=1892852 RepID=A0A5B2XLU8_9PSEU|nr:GNAT family protein [Solihabitans fulvus]KAA2264326.1 GNAT family N-acetyltransferase [Solihabitans fulvus]
MNLVRIDGDPVCLRDWNSALLSDLPDLLDPTRPWHDTNGPYFGRMTEAEAAEQVRRTGELAALPAIERETPRRRLAVMETATGRLVGEVSWYWESQETDWRRLGVLIYDETCWGRGYGTEALRLWTGYLFASTDALRLDYATFSGNPGMIATGRKLGFVEEGRFRRARRWAGGVHDSVVLGVLREEWVERHSLPDVDGWPDPKECTEG